MKMKDFAACMAYLSAAVQKPCSKETVEVYFDLLQDLPLGVLQTACKQVALLHQWATFPSVAEVRQAALEVQQGAGPSASEAWACAQRVARSYDPEIQGEYTRGGKTYQNQLAALLDGLHPLVVQAVTFFGPLRLVSREEKVGVLAAQFAQVYQQCVAAQKAKALLPAALKQEIAAARCPEIGGLIQGIGVMK